MNKSMTDPILDIRGLTKTYRGGVTALDGVDLQIKRGEIFALLGPNGAGKTTLIAAVCGLVRPSGGTMHVLGEDLGKHWKRLRQQIGLVPQEISLDIFDTVMRQVRYSRGMFGCPPDDTADRRSAAQPQPVGQARRQNSRAFRRNEAPRDDCQGALA